MTQVVLRGKPEEVKKDMQAIARPEIEIARLKAELKRADLIIDNQTRRIAKYKRLVGHLESLIEGYKRRLRNKPTARIARAMGWLSWR